MVVTKGHITTIASLMAVDLRQSNVNVSNNTRISIKLQDSDVMNNVNLNWNAVTNIDIIGENYFRCKFDMTLNTKKSVVLTNGNSISSSSSALAVLSYAKDGKNYTYTMVDPQIEISGPDGQKGVSSIFVLENEGILAPHVQIRYLAETGKFQIAALGKTKLNGKELELSQDGMAKWYALANNSKIFINDEVSVKFEVR